RREPDPQVPVFLAQGEASEEPRPHEIAPAPEHGSDLHARPATHRLVQLARDARPSALETPPGLATGPQAAHTGGRSRLRRPPPSKLPPGHEAITSGSRQDLRGGEALALRHLVDPSSQSRAGSFRGNDNG